MKDRDKPKPHGAAGDAESIVELTPDMEMSEGSEVKIIDLTDAIDGPADIPAVAPPAETAPQVEKTTLPEPGGQDAPDAIEQAVDAAFDAVQAPIQEPAAGENTDSVQVEPATEEESSGLDEELIDRLSDIPRKVDQAMEMAGTDDIRIEKITPKPAEPDVTPEDPGDFADISADAADLESAMAEFTPDGEDDDILDLTQIVDPTELQADDGQMDGDDEELIELIDIVDPAELRVSAVTADQDDEGILDLTDIVDPAELQVNALTRDQDDEDILELTDIADPAELEAAPDHATPQASERIGDLGDRQAGEAMDESLIEEQPQDIQSLPEEPEPEQTNRADAITIGAIPPFEEERPHENSVIQLSDVLNQGMPKEEKLPIEQIKVGAEDELAQQSISLEAEVTADALGMDLENEAREENTALTDREIEAAVERIIQTKYAETIERLISKAVEKAVTREIENIKRAMLDGDDPLGLA